MSYSFTVKAATKQLAKVEVALQFEKAVAAQACHERDRLQALAAANAYVDLLAEDDSRDVVVAMSGGLTGQWQGSDVTRIEGASLSVSAYLTVRT